MWKGILVYRKTEWTITGFELCAIEYLNTELGAGSIGDTGRGRRWGRKAEWTPDEAFFARGARQAPDRKVLQTFSMCSRFYPQRPSRQAVATRVVPSPPDTCLHLMLHRVQHSHSWSIFSER